MNLQNFSITDTGQVITISFGGQSFSVPVIILTATMYSDDGIFLADYTGANALVFPAFLSQVPFNATDSISLQKLLAGCGDDLLQLKYKLENP